MEPPSPSNLHATATKKLDNNMCSKTDSLINYGIANATKKKRRSILRTKSLQESLDASVLDGEQRETRRAARHNVDFDVVEIRSYPVLVDKSQDGLALTMGWKHVSTDVTTVQDRYLERSMRAPAAPRPLSAKERVDVLLGAGYQEKELIQHMISAACGHVDVLPGTGCQKKELVQHMISAACGHEIDISMSSKSSQTTFSKLKRAARKLATSSKKGSSRR